MKIEVLYVAACPSHPAAVQLVRDVLRAEGVAADVREVLVTDENMARGLRFHGSPTILINGRDVAGEGSNHDCFGPSCRLYSGSEHVGLPPVDLVRRAVLQALEGGPT
jgi:hypothetical protein